MEKNGNLEEINKHIAELRVMKKQFLSRMTPENKKDINWWTRQFDKEIRSYLKMRDQFN